MQKVPVSLEEQHLALLEERREQGEVGSRSAVARQILDEYEQLHIKYKQQSDHLKSREARIEQLEDPLTKCQQIEDKIEALPEKVRETESSKAGGDGRSTMWGGSCA